MDFVHIKFKDNEKVSISNFLYKRINSLVTTLNELYQDKIISWRRASEAVPAEAIREFPFYNASNIVIPIIGIFSDTLLARILTQLMETKPIWRTRFYGQHKAEGLDESVRENLEDFLEYVAIEPQELDIHRVYHEWISEGIQYGTSVLKINHVREKIFVMNLSETGDEDFLPQLIYSGPRVEKIRFEDFLISPTAKKISPTEFIAQRLHLTKKDLSDRFDDEFYDKDLMDEIISQPDNYGSTTMQAQESDAGVQTDRSDDVSAEWIVYECHFQTKIGGKKTNVIIWYHYRTKKILRAVYNPFVVSRFVACRLLPRPDMFHGYGFCELLWAFQEEISTIHNERLNNRAIANSRVFRVNPDSKLNDGFRIFPSAMLPAMKDEIEAIAMGDVSPQSIDDEKLSLELAERRSGVSPPMQGFGAGAQSGKRGVYSAMGTLSLMQAGNRRANMNTLDIHYAHQMVGRTVLDDYAIFGINPETLSLFGESADKIKLAITAYRNKKLAIPVYSSSPSDNKEVEKQNYLMITQIVNKHYSTITQMIQMASSGMIPQGVKDYIVNVAIPGADTIMRMALRAFGIEDFERLIPDVNKNVQGAKGNSQEPVAGAPNPVPVGQSSPTSGFLSGASGIPATALVNGNGGGRNI